MDKNLKFLRTISTVSGVVDQLALFEFEIFESPTVSEHFFDEDAPAPLIIARDGGGDEFASVQIDEEHLPSSLKLLFQTPMNLR